MLDPRIYRTWLIAVALGVIVLAFSLLDEPGALTTTLAPEAFNGQNAFATMNTLAARAPHRRPGSAGDSELAGYVATQLQAEHYSVSTDTFTARTADGTRTLENVTGTVAGLSNGTIVVVSHRDSLTAPAISDLSGAAVMLELGRILAEGTHQHTLVLASTSGSAGAAGAAELARHLPGPVDAVIVLGDLAGTSTHFPLVVPWSNAHVLAPPALRNTLAAALGSQAQMQPGNNSLVAQFVHLAFPIADSEQGPFGAFGDPAVLLSLSGDRIPAPDEPTSPARITSTGRALLQAVTAMDSGGHISAPSAYLLFDNKVIPAWAVRLFVLALMVPVLAVTVDGLARVRRRRHGVLRWVAWVLSAAVPFALAAVAVPALRLVGLIGAAPPGPVPAGAIPMHGAGAATLAILAFVILGGFLLRFFLLRAVGLGSGGRAAAEPGAGAALLIVLCVIALVIWYSNPFAAALLVPALHFWIWAVSPELRARRPVGLVLLLVGIAIPALAVFYYAHAAALTPIATAWNGVLMLAGGDIALRTALEWSVFLGCATSFGLIALRAVPDARRVQATPPARGQIGYTGRGSLRGTQSALRR